MKCRSPRCSEEVSERGKWCEFHGELLARVRQELESSKEGFNSRGIKGDRRRDEDDEDDE